MGLQWAEHTIEIAASPEEVFEAITDYETFARWQSAVISAEVEEWDRNTKRGELVKFEADGRVRTISYTLRYHYDPPEKIGWDFIEGDGINDFQGSYVIRPDGDGATATYKVGIDVTGVPGPILKRVHRATIKKVNEDLKAEAERRAATGAGDSPPTVEQPREPAPAYSGGPSHPFDLLPGPLDDLAKLPGKVMVKVGRRLGG